MSFTDEQILNELMVREENIRRRQKGYPIFNKPNSEIISFYGEIQNLDPDHWKLIRDKFASIIQGIENEFIVEPKQNLTTTEYRMLKDHIILLIHPPDYGRNLLMNLI